MNTGKEQSSYIKYGLLYLYLTLDAEKVLKENIGENIRVSEKKASETIYGK